MLESLPIDLLQFLVEMSDWPLKTYCQFIGLSRSLRTKFRGRLHNLNFEFPRDDDDSTDSSQRYAPVLRPDTLAALMAPCQNSLRSLALPSGCSLTGCGREEASFAGWVDAAFGGGLGATLRSLTIRSLEGLSSGALRRMLGHMSALEHFSVTFHLPDDGAPGEVLAMLCPACPHLRTLHLETERCSVSVYLFKEVSCAPLAGCPELVELTLGDFPVNVASLNSVLPRLPLLQVLRAARAFSETLPEHPTPLDFSLLPHPEQLRILTHPTPSAHFELLTGLEEYVGCPDEAIFPTLAPHLRRVVAVTELWGDMPVAMPHLAEFEGQYHRCPPAAWQTLERATLYGTSHADLRLVAPRLRHLAVLPGPRAEVASVKHLDVPSLESLDLYVGDKNVGVDLHSPSLRSLTLRAYSGHKPILPWPSSCGGRFDHLRTLNIEQSPEPLPQPDMATVLSALALAPNLTTLKGIALTDHAHLPLLANLCTGALLPQLTHLDAITTPGPKGLRLQCSSPTLRVLAIHLYNQLSRHVLQIIGPGLVRLHVEAKRMPPLTIEASQLRSCRLEARAYQPPVRLTAPALRWLSFECHNDNISALPAVLTGLPALRQLRLVVPWLPAVIPQILMTAPGHPLIDLTLLVRGSARTVPLEVTLPPWVRSLEVMEQAVEVRLHEGPGLESIDVARAVKLSLDDGAWPNLVRVTSHPARFTATAFPPPTGVPSGCRVAIRYLY
ncbi:hypothetical protein PAPYR_9310 [Paratrimastix pyriformis]|uniref:F-box domain-containing protein n=1 Tax=Paratrimastix pyriformis TaxID=342808 RepID=A0ABQ8UA93_9EUKA|nr:hypothetical protein PAPYR_9310 [Paratrimastix pyriformis]